MLRWNDVADKIILGFTTKMYREPFVGQNYTKTPHKNLELDHYAFKHLGSELFSYKILDSNFITYMEERGDLSRMGSVSIPSNQDQLKTVL